MVGDQNAQQQQYHGHEWAKWKRRTAHEDTVCTTGRDAVVAARGEAATLRAALGPNLADDAGAEG